MDWIPVSTTLPGHISTDPMSESVWVLIVAQRMAFGWHIARYNYKWGCWETRDGVFIDADRVPHWAELTVPRKSEEE